jgi:hypothetical protein
LGQNARKSDHEQHGFTSSSSSQKTNTKKETSEMAVSNSGSLLSQTQGTKSVAVTCAFICKRFPWDKAQRISAQLMHTTYGLADLFSSIPI